MEQVPLIHNPVCPACAEPNTMQVGKIHKFEGAIKLEDPGYLFVCPGCSLRFRFPYPDEKALVELYKNIELGIWSYEGGRADFILAREAVINYSKHGKVLDVGCFRGDFLKSLPDSVSAYGIEPSPDARKVAEQNGVSLIAESIDAIADSTDRFDVVTMLDVIEHLPKPMDALRKLVDTVKPGGVLIISTGNLSALPWKMMPLDYWYYFPEHVSFFNRGWFKWASHQLGLNLVGVEKFSHFESTLLVRLRQLSESIVYRVVHIGEPTSFWGKLIRCIYPFSRASKWTSPPKTNAWRDHMFIVLRKELLS